MPDGFTVADMVAEVALGVPEILAAEDGEHDRVDLLGASMGGFLALQLAADYPDLVRRVVLTASAHTVGPAGLALEDEWTVMVRERRWVALYLGIIRTCYVGFKREWLSLAVISAWPWLRRGPDAPEDGMRQVRACMRFDIGDRLGEIAAPVMLIGGASDRYFTPNLIAQTAELLAEAYVHIVAGASHAVAAQFAPEHDRIALAFLNETTEQDTSPFQRKRRGVSPAGQLKLWRVLTGGARRLFLDLKYLEEFSMDRQHQHAQLPNRTHDEQALQDFIQSFKLHLARNVVTGNRAVYEETARPEFERAHDRSPNDRNDVHDAMAAQPYYRMWSALQRVSQDMNWNAATDNVARQPAGFDLSVEILGAAARHASATPGGCHAELPQCGRYPLRSGQLSWRDSRRRSRPKGAIYDRGGYVYSMGGWGSQIDAMGRGVVDHIKATFPDLKPARILDMGCTIGGSTLPYVDAFPDAEVFAIDARRAVPAVRALAGRGVW